jgi:hypothetical protein
MTDLCLEVYHAMYLNEADHGKRRSAHLLPLVTRSMLTLKFECPSPT